MTDAGATRTHATPVSADRRVFIALPLAIVAVQIVFGGVDLLLAAALDQVEPGAGVTTYGWITGIASLCALLIYPLAGAASDRTPSRLPRRTVWVAIGAIASAVGLLALGQVQAVGPMGVSYVVAFASLPIMLVALYASIPDRVASGRRGAIGALVGAATIVGGVAGNVLAARFASRIAIGTAVFAGVLLAGAALYAAIGRERNTEAPAPSGDARSDMDPGRRADFVWFAIGRFAVFVGYTAVTGLAYYVMRDHIRVDDPANRVAAFAVVSGVTTLAASLVAGSWSDRVGRRKPFVAGASLLLAVGLMAPIASPTVPAFLLAAGIIGLGFGTYLAVGTALGTLVLPSDKTSGRDLGFIGLATASAQAIAPVAGSYVAAVLGYQALFVAAGMASAIGALAVLPIRSVR